MVASVDTAKGESGRIVFRFFRRTGREQAPQRQNDGGEGVWIAAGAVAQQRRLAIFCHLRSWKQIFVGCIYLYVLVLACTYLYKRWIVWAKPSPGIGGEVIRLVVGAIPGPGGLAGPLALAAKQPKKHERRVAP